MLRRVVTADGRSRAFVNDEPVGVALLRRLGALLVEVQGQHDQVGLADPASHGGLLDAFGALEARRAPCRRRPIRAWRGRRARAEGGARGHRRRPARRGMAAPRRGRVERPRPGRRARKKNWRRTPGVAARRTPGRGHRGGAVRNAAPRSPRRRGARRGAPQRRPRAGAPAAAERGGRAALTALAAAQDALAEAENVLERLATTLGPIPAAWRTWRSDSSRCAPPRGSTRCRGGPAGISGRCASGWRAWTPAPAAWPRWSARRGTRGRPTSRPRGPSRRRGRRRAAKLEKAVGKELAPLKLDRARLHIEIGRARRKRLGTDGQDRVDVPGHHQPRAEAGAAGQDRLGRRAVAPDAGAEGGAGARLARADAGVRRGGQRHRRRHGRGGGRAAGARGGAAAGAGRDPLAPGGGARRAALPGGQGRARRPGRDARGAAGGRRGARRSPACWPASG